MRQFTTKTALLHAAESHPGVAGAVAVKEDTAALQLAGKALGLRLVGGVDRCRQAKFAVVGEGQRMVCVTGGGQGRDRTKQLGGSRSCRR